MKRVAHDEGRFESSSGLRKGGRDVHPDPSGPSRGIVPSTLFTTHPFHPFRPPFSVGNVRSGHPFPQQGGRTR